MNKEDLFKKSVYIVIAILILLFFTRDCDFFKDDFYKNIQSIKDPNNFLVLVNKNNQLPADYIPEDLVLLDTTYAHSEKYLRKTVKESFERLNRDASILGYKVVITSAYRDYFYQERLYNQYVEEKGLEYADSCSARPGHSEHQTGLSFDVMGSNEDYDEFEASNEFEWMRDNAHLYGFILRYPKGKTNITGFKYEPWHYRYVGVTAAKIIYEKNLTLEEYIDKYEKK